MGELEYLEQQMKMVFDSAILKALSRGNKPGNTWRPWEDFSIEHLKKRMYDEIGEYEESGNSQELIDVINMACFLRLAHLVKSVEKMSGIIDL